MPKIGSVTQWGPKEQIAYVGVDPGKSGGIVEIIGRTVRWYVMPNTWLDTWAVIEDLGRRDKINGLSEFTHHSKLAVIERVNVMPKQGISSAFTFGTGYGALLMALTAADIPYETTPPQTWMKDLGIPSGKSTESKATKKNKLRAKAQQLYPSLDLWKERKGVQMAVCDALLIAHYCKMRNHG